MNAPSTQDSNDLLATPDSVSTQSESGTGIRIAIAAVLVCGILLGLLVYGLISRHHEQANLAAQMQQAADAPIAVDVMPVERAGRAEVLSLPGNAKAFNETTIYARTSGYLKDWKHDIGDHVHAGDLLATIETPELDDQLAASEAKVTEQKSEVELANAAVKFAQLSFDRWQSAVPEGVVSTQDRDQKQAELDTSKAKLEAASAQLKLAESDVQRLKTLIGFKAVVAPFDGVITRRAVDLGDLITAGSTTSTTPLFSIANSQQIRVFVDVPQSASASIKVGMDANVTATDSQHGPFDGKVSRTADSIDPMSRTLRTEVLVPNLDNALKPGMYVEVGFLTNRENPPLTIPASALIQRTDGPQVALVNAKGIVHFAAVHIQRDLGDRIEIDSGLSDGEDVALNISSEIADGDRIDRHTDASDVAEGHAPVPPQPIVVQNRPTVESAVVK